MNEAQKNALRIVVNNFKLYISYIVKNQQEFIDKKEKLNLISKIFPLYTSSEIRFEGLESKNVGELTGSRSNNLKTIPIIRAELKYRRTRNEMFHPKERLDFVRISNVKVLKLIEYTFDWFINPLQIPEVRDFFNNLNKK